MPTTHQLENFIEKLAETKISDHTVNQYSFDSENNAIRRRNLLLYFLQLAERKPSALLVGEAPGYQGARQSGVPFGSEFIILNGLEKIGLFGAHRGYQKTDEYPDKIWKEPSATIVWEILTKIPQLPLIWASFPFHPHQPGKSLSNRAPNSLELEIGKIFLQQLIEMFEINRVIAVGNKAEQTLTGIGIVAPKIRHPSHGGKNEFASGISEHLGKE